MGFCSAPRKGIGLLPKAGAERLLQDVERTCPRVAAAPAHPPAAGTAPKEGANSGIYKIPSR